MKKTRLNIFFAILGGLILLVAVWLTSVFWDLPAAEIPSEALYRPSVRITDRDGRLLYEVLPEESGRHVVLPVESIPQCLKDATIAVEDKNFYTHPGVDLGGILRSVWINLTGGETIAGGSTITQQVARNLLLGEEVSQRTLRRKLREAVLAWELTRKLSKDEILAFYLNETYYGGMAYGVEAAAQTYFGKPAADLTVAECALVAGLPQAPSLYNPYTDPDAARQRQLVVLGLMEEQGFLSADERQQAENYPLSYNPSPYPILAPHFTWLVQTELDRLYASGLLDPNTALVVRTTLDLDAQQAAEAAIQHTLDRYAESDPVLDRRVNNAALVAMDPQTGEVLAFVGSADYFDEAIHGAIDMATARRQPGSAFKPFLYAAVLDPETASPWTAATPILDVTTTFLNADGQPYTPQDYDDREHGPVSVRTALAASLNIPAVLTLDHAGIGTVVNLAEELGIQSLADQTDYDLSLALGGGEMTLLELTTAYATLANEGCYPAYTILLDIRDTDGNLLYQPDPIAQPQVLDPRVAWLLSDILSDDQARSLAFGLNSTLKLEFPVAVKTGTTNNYHDNWTVGYTPDLVVGVWVGNAGYESMRNVTGLTGAAPIWNEVMRTLLRGQPEQNFIRPEGLVQVEICDLSGLLPTADCPHTRLEWFIDGTEPTEPDNIYHTLVLDSATGQPATDATPIERRYPVTVLDLPVEAWPWARANGLLLLSDFSTADKIAAEGDLILLSPRPNTTYKLVDTFDPAAQQLLVEAVPGPGVTGVTLWVDGVLLASVDVSPYRAWWPLAVGEHTFHAEAVAADGSRVVSDPVTVTVVSGP